jgi:hypothetical protein
MRQTAHPTVFALPENTTRAVQHIAAAGVPQTGELPNQQIVLTSRIPRASRFDRFA